MANFIDRMVGAAKLNVGVYEEVEADTGATGQAMGVVSCPVSPVGSDPWGWALEALVVSSVAVSRH